MKQMIHVVLRRSPPATFSRASLSFHVTPQTA